jgi:hypothetical protein
MHVYPIEVIAMVILGVALWYFRKSQKAAQGPGAGKDAGKKDAGRPSFPGFGARKPAAKVKETPEETYMGLRQQALATTAENLALAVPLKPNDPWGALMEMAIPSSVVTLACFADGDARFYYKTGGGMVGGVSHEKVRRASLEFLTAARKALTKMRRTAEFPLPAPDKIRFYVLTSRGVYTTETYREDLGEVESELSTLFASGQEVVAQMREVQEKKSEGMKPLFRPAPMPVDEPDAPAGS